MYNTQGLDLCQIQEYFLQFPYPSYQSFWQNFASNTNLNCLPSALSNFSLVIRFLRVYGKFGDEKCIYLNMQKYVKVQYPLQWRIDKLICYQSSSFFNYTLKDTNLHKYPPSTRSKSFTRKTDRKTKKRWLYSDFSVTQNSFYETHSEN